MLCFKITMPNEHDRIGRMCAYAEPHVGIFWAIATSSGEQLLSASCALSAAETYGDCLTFGPGHYQVWQGWRRSRELDSLPRAVVRAFEYEAWPRGRIVFDRVDDRFRLYADRQLFGERWIALICERFKLPREKTVAEGDLHYRSVENISP